MKKNVFFIGTSLVAFLFVLNSCLNRSSGPGSVDPEPVDVSLKQYGKALFDIDQENISTELKNLSGDFFFFIGDSYDDTLSIIQIMEFLNDPLNMEIAYYCNQKYPDIEFLREQLNTGFGYYHHYYPEESVPEIYTYISGLNYENPVSYADSVLIIALDMYLGDEFLPYRNVGIPFYRVQRMDAPFIAPDCFKEFAVQRHIKQTSGHTLLDEMIYHGKVLLFLDYMLPDVADEFKIGYTSGQKQWVEDNESSLWSFLIENDLLFTSRYYEINKLIQDGPFTTGFGKESPAMLGRWLGWQIMRSYAEKHPEKSLEELMLQPDPAEILGNSGYRPGR
jgi:hypothetical protein